MIAPAQAIETLSTEAVALDVLEHARDELDETLFVLVGPGGLLDWALGVRWRPRRSAGWRAVGATRELVRDGLATEALLAGLRAAAGGLL